MRRTSRGGRGVGVLIGVIVGESMGSMGTMNTVVPLHISIWENVAWWSGHAPNFAWAAWISGQVGGRLMLLLAPDGVVGGAPRGEVASTLRLEVGPLGAPRGAI
jgi:hypothetical protein